MSVPPPALCRLCRRPIVSSAARCPACGARQSLSDRAWGISSPRPRRGWWIGAGTALLILTVIGTIVWLSVLREIKGPITSRPSGTECAELLSELTNRPAPDQRVSAELRDRIRQCFDRR